MKLSFLSNYYTHHQQSVCEAWYNLTENSFAFVATEKITEERRRLGWESQTNVPFLVHCENEDIPQDITDAEYVILGNAPMAAVQSRLVKGKTVFKYSERVFKKGYNYAKWLPRLFTYYRNYGRYKSLYLLSASAFASADFAKHFVFRNKSYKWGYFPETKYYDEETLFAQKEENKLLWCGRLIDWKHPELVIELAKALKAEGIAFSIDIIGTGELETALADEINKQGINDCVKLLGAMPPEQVRVYMEKSSLFLFTSDFNEGWGAVLNEAMNSGCATVASHAIGAVPFLIKHGENGLVYKNGNTDDFILKVKALLRNKEKQRQLGKKAYRTITELWNAELAAQRFLRFAEEIEKNGKCELYEEGPCSKAKAIKNNWFTEENYDIPWIKNQMG